MHVPARPDAVNPAVIVLLNLSRDQLDRVGEINHRTDVAYRPGPSSDAAVVANCDDVLMTSAAYDCPNVVWARPAAVGANDSVSCPRSGEVIVREA